MIDYKCWNYFFKRKELLNLLHSQPDSFSKNLKLLSSYYQSIAEICRKMAINRQQFNKYLSGSTSPSIKNMRKIADFFGVTESELILPHDDFAKLLSNKPRKRDRYSQSDKLQEMLYSFTNQEDDSEEILKKYCGYYFGYVMSSIWPDYIIKFLGQIYQDEGFTFWNIFERSTSHLDKASNNKTINQAGWLLYRAERIIVFERSYYPTELTQGMTILYANHRVNLQYMSGIYLQTTSTGLRRPYASRILLEYLGEEVDDKITRNTTGLFKKYDSSHISPNILSIITNELDPVHNSLMPVEL